MKEHTRSLFALGTGLWLTLAGCGLGMALAGCEAGDDDVPPPDTTEEPPPADDDAVSSVGADTAPMGVEGSSSIEGRIVYQGDIPTPPRISMDADPQCAAKHDEPVRSQALVVGDDSGLANVLVKVASGLPEGNYPPPEEPFVMDQQGCQYQPHVMAVIAGQDLKVLNSDELLHNVHALSRVNPAFNRAMPAAVEEAVFELPRPEDAFQVKCDVHPWMNAYIEVTEHPFFDVSDANGAFTIEGLPAGTYEIEAWHERLGTQTATVTVEEGESASNDFTFTRE